jgi:soluble lytic murein transglycosylase-like protein
MEAKERSGFLSSLARNYKVWVTMPMLGAMAYLSIAGKDPDLPEKHKEQEYATAQKPEAKGPAGKPKRALKYATQKSSYQADAIASPVKSDPEIGRKLFSGQQWLEKAVMRKIDDIVNADELRKQGRRQVSIDDLSMLFSKGTAYRDYIDPMSRDVGVPRSVCYALIARESGSFHLAFGPTKDAGLWQISPDTGRSLGLITKEADYRFDPEFATKAIGRMFKELKSRYGTRWHLIANAYNHGGRNLDRDLKSRTPMKPHVRDHTITVMAYAYLYEMKDKYGIKIRNEPLYSEMASSTRKIKVGKEGVAAVSKTYNISRETISYLNPAVLNPVRGYETKGHIRLPL